MSTLALRHLLAPTTTRRPVTRSAGVPDHFTSFSGTSRHLAVSPLSSYVAQTGREKVCAPSILLGCLPFLEPTLYGHSTPVSALVLGPDRGQVPTKGTTPSGRPSSLGTWHIDPFDTGLPVLGAPTTARRTLEATPDRRRVWVYVHDAVPPAHYPPPLLSTAQTKLQSCPGDCLKGQDSRSEVVTRRTDHFRLNTL